MREFIKRRARKSCAAAIFTTVGAVLATTTASAGSPTSGDQTITLTFGGIQRSYLLHVPTSYAPNTAWPLLLVATGAYGDGTQIAGATRFDFIATNAFIAYPNPNGVLWQIGGPNNDVQFFAAVVASVQSSYIIDPARISIAGFSDGGRLAVNYACAQSPGTYVAGLAIVADDLNSTDQAKCNANPPAPMPMLSFHGTADPASPYTGSRAQYSAAATAQYFATLFDCHFSLSFTRPDQLSSGAPTTDTVQKWQHCAHGPVSFWTINGGGHSWPGSLSTPHPVTKLGPVSLDLPASLIIWHSFANATQP